MTKRLLALLLTVFAALLNLVLFFGITTSYFLFPGDPAPWPLYGEGALAVLLLSWLEAGAAKWAAAKWAGERKNGAAALEKAEIAVKIVFAVCYLGVYVAADVMGMIVRLKVYGVVALFLILFLSPIPWQLRRGKNADGGEKAP